MPIYEYQCPKCQHTFEKLVKLGENPQCPACEFDAPERLQSFSAAISTNKTRSQAIGNARARSSVIKKEQDQAQREYEKHIREDHHH